MDTRILEEIGLTKSEIRVFLALLKLGTSTKKDIVKEAGITPSKLYEITDKLIEKGLASYVKENKVLHFRAAPPEQVLDFLERKKENIEEQGRQFSHLIPQLKSLTKVEEPQIEVFRGWKGMRTVYRMILEELKSGDTDLVFGAGQGEDSEKVWQFFNNFHKERRKKKITQKIIVNTKVKEWALTALNNPKYDKVRFIEHTSPSEVNIWGDNVMIVILTKIPVVTLIKSKVTADSFRDYFEQLWKLAKK